MKLLGKVKHYECVYSAEKTREDGSKYFSEKYMIYFECGDDELLIETKFYSVAEKGMTEEILNRKGIKVGARGEIKFSCGYREWNGKRFRDIILETFDSMDVASLYEQPQEEEQHEAAPQPKEADVKLDTENTMMPF